MVILQFDFKEHDPKMKVTTFKLIIPSGMPPLDAITVLYLDRMDAITCWIISRYEVGIPFKDRRVWIFVTLC